MIGIKVNGGFLQLAPDTSAEIERESPFFSIDQINTEYSNPINFLYTKENCRLLGMKYHYYVERQKTTVEADIYSGTTYKGRGTLIVESGKLNLTNVEDTILTGYVLFGISRFFQVIRDKKLTDLSLGGTRSFNWTTSNPYDGSGGYWQHFHSTWTDNTIPYVFAPVRNEAYYGDQSDIDWMNKPAADGSLALDYTTPIVPMIRLEYLLRCIFQENGFTVDFSRIPDQHWKKIILINPVKLEWTRVGPINTGGRITYGPTAAPQVKINLTKHLPQKQTISDFLIQLFYRFGWAPIFTGNNCSFIPVKVLPTSTRKDWSAYASPEADTSFNAEKKIYAFKNDINGNDSAPERPDMEGITIYRNVGYQRDLPTAGSDNVEKIAYCYYENHYYKST